MEMIDLFQILLPGDFLDLKKEKEQKYRRESKNSSLAYTVYELDV